MATWLRQSTTVDVSVGPFLDDTDGKTAETTLTITQPDIRIKKDGNAWAQKNASQTLSHEENGWYEIALDATDTNTMGPLLVAVHEAGTLPVWREFMVVSANVYDSMFGSDLLQVDTREVTGTVQTARDLGLNIDATVSSRASQTSVTTIDDFLDTEIGAILTDTNELQTDLVNGGRLDLLIDAIKAKTDNLPTDPADQSLIIAAIDVINNQVTDAFGDLHIRLTNSGVVKGQELEFVFAMTDATLHTPKTGLIDGDFTKKISIDGGTETTLVNNVSEIGNGWYKITITSSETNGRVLAIRLVAASTDTTMITIITNGQEI